MSSLLQSAGDAPASRSASAVVAKAARGFQVFRIDGYSVTTTLPGGERISSEPFVVGGRRWCVDYYPNGATGDDDDSDAIALYLRLQGSFGSHRRKKKERVRADYKLSLLDAAGNAAYELPAERGAIFVSTGGYGSSDDDDGVPPAENPSSCGYAAFITKEDLGRRSESLLGEDCLAIRCDVAVAEVEAIALGRIGGPRRRRRSPSFSSDSPESSSDEDDGYSSHGGEASA